MSTLRVSTIQDTAGSNSSTPAAIANGICKAWVNFNGTGVVAIRAQYNVSSITDNAVGDYTVNFTAALSDANYSVNGIASNFTGNQPNCVMTALASGSSYLLKTTSAVRIYTADTDGASTQDCFDVNVAIFR